MTLADAAVFQYVNFCPCGDQNRSTVDFVRPKICLLGYGAGRNTAVFPELDECADFEQSGRIVVDTGPERAGLVNDA